MTAMVVIVLPYNLVNEDASKKEGIPMEGTDRLGAPLMDDVIDWLDDSVGPWSFRPRYYGNRVFPELYLSSDEDATLFRLRFGLAR